MYTEYGTSPDTHNKSGVMFCSVYSDQKCCGIGVTKFDQEWHGGKNWALSAFIQLVEGEGRAANGRSQPSPRTKLLPDPAWEVTPMPARVVRNISNTLSNTFRSRKRQRRSIHFDTDRLPRPDSDGDQEDMMGGSEEEEEESGEELAGGRGGKARLINLQANTPRRQTRRTGGTGVVRLQRRSSLPRRSSPHQNQSYRYQNSESTLLHPNNQHSLRTKEASTSNTTLKPSNLSNATTQRRRQLRILSPLPVNHSIPRHLRHRHVMPHSPIAVGGKRLREPSGTPIRRVVRTRSSNTLVLSDERVKKRKRDAKMIVSDEEEAVETGEGESAGEEVEEDEWEEEEEEVPAARRLRSSDAKVASNSDHEEDLEEPEGDEEEPAEEEEDAGDSDVVEEEEDDIDMTLEGKSTFCMRGS